MRSCPGTDIVHLKHLKSLPMWTIKKKTLGAWIILDSWMIVAGWITLACWFIVNNN